MFSQFLYLFKELHKQASEFSSEVVDNAKCNSQWWPFFKVDFKKWLLQEKFTYLISCN